MNWLGQLLRRARFRGLKEGQVQVARAEALADDAKDNAERWQDYGFAANPVDGQGLVINAGGHTIVLRFDRIAERPQLEAYEVAVWHHEGHSVTLKAGKLVQVDCDQFVVNAAVKTTITTPDFELNASTQSTINTATHTVNASTAANVNTPTLAASENVTAGANITATGNVADAGGAKTMAGMRAVYDGHDHVEHDGGTTNTPNAAM